MAAGVHQQSIPGSRDQKMPTCESCPPVAKTKVLNPCGPNATNADLKSLPSKLVKLMSALSNVPKDKFNAGEGYKYLSSDALMDRINPACVKLGLATVVDTELLDWREKTTKSGMIWQIVSVKVTVTIIDSDSGEFLQTQGIGGGQDAGDKAFSKAQTQGRKYAFMLAMNISTGDDPESNESIDKADDSVPCRKCGKGALYVKIGEFEDKQVKCYICPA
jgi:hypothetical protein